MSIAKCDLPMLFEQFELIRESADAVSKLRELILDLSVRGKLVVYWLTMMNQTNPLLRCS